MADALPPITSLNNINNLNTDETNTPTLVAAKLQVVDGRLIADDRQTDRGVVV